MDFHTLSRKELQALCKKNKIPANMTNVAMANALEALQQVEGLEEILNPVEPDGQKFPDEKGVETPRTSCRTSTRRNPVREEPESSKISTRLQSRTRARNDEGIDQENKDLNAPATPAVPNSRRRTPGVSTRRKKEDERPTDHVPKTPAASSTTVRATSAYNTRRSVRLLEKNLSKMSLMDTEETGSEKVDEISEEISSVSQQIENSENTVKGASSQTVISTEVLEEIDESEVTSSKKNTGFEYQSNDSKSEVQSGSECCDESDADLTKSIDKEVDDANNEAGTGISCQIENSRDSSESKNISPGANKDAFFVDKLMLCPENKPVVEMNDSAEILVSDGDVEDIEADASSVVAEDKDKESEHLNVCHDIQNKEAIQAEISVPKGDAEDDASVVVSDDKHKDNECLNVANDYIQSSEQMFWAEGKAVEVADDEVQNSAKLCIPKGDAEDDAYVVVSDEKHKKNESLNGANDYIQSSEQMFMAEDKAVEMANDAQNSEQMFCAEKKAVEMEGNTSPLITVCEELEARVKTSSDMEESKECVAKDANTQICIKPSPEENMKEESIPFSHSSLVRIEAEAEAEPETKDIQIDNNEECSEHAEAVEETLDATGAFHCAPTSNEQRTSAPIEFPCQAQSVLKGNLNNDDLQEKSMRELKKMLRNLSLDGKTNTKSSNSVKEVEKKRIALQALPENQMTGSNGQP